MNTITKASITTAMLAVAASAAKIHLGDMSLAQTKVQDRIEVRLDSDEPSSLIEGNATCNEEQNATIDNALAAIYEPVWAAFMNEDPDLWLKWFGEGTAESDADVDARFYDAAWLMDEKDNYWNVLCCTNNRGACNSCTGSVKAYVTSTMGADGV